MIFKVLPMILWCQMKEGLNCSKYFVMEKRAGQAGLYLAQPFQCSPRKHSFLIAPAETSTLHLWHSKTLPHILSFNHVVSFSEGGRPQMDCMLWRLTWSFWVLRFFSGQARGMNQTTCSGGLLSLDWGEAAVTAQVRIHGHIQLLSHKLCQHSL